MSAKREAQPKGKWGLYDEASWKQYLHGMKAGEQIPDENLDLSKLYTNAFIDQINGFEKYLTENNIHLLKFFLHISKDEQAERLQSRLENPRKQWKFETADLAMRESWKEFMEAYEIMLNECSTPWAPWHIIPANRKWYRDYVIAQVIVEAMEKLKLKWPKPKEDLSKIKIV